MSTTSSPDSFSPPDCLLAPPQAEHQRLLADSAILQLVVAALQEGRLAEAAQLVADHLRRAVSADAVAIGGASGGRGGCRLVAVTGVRKIDRRTDQSRAIEAAMDEALQHSEPTRWPPATGDQGRALTHRALTASFQSPAAITIPLRRVDDQPIGAITLLGQNNLVENAPARDFLQRSQQPLGEALRLLAAAGGKLRKSETIGNRRTTRIAWCGGAAAVLIAMLLPVPHRVACDVELQPVIRRFVAAPFEGRLEKSLREPGDMVSQDEVLARMDARELRLEMMGLQADYDRAKKQRDAALAKGAGVDAQIARLEMQNVQSKLELLRNRQQSLEIRSPLNGVVVAGDLQRVEGAPLSVGQAMYEIAPLDKMIVELAIPEREIAYVQPGNSVKVGLSAFPQREWSGTVERIHPRSELVDDEAVFIAELTIDNAGRLLRPGMNGRAKIRCGRKLLAWTLFHRPIEALAMRLGW